VTFETKSHIVDRVFTMTTSISQNIVNHFLQESTGRMHIPVAQLIGWPIDLGTLLQPQSPTLTFFFWKGQVVWVELPNGDDGLWASFTEQSPHHATITRPVCAQGKLISTLVKEKTISGNFLSKWFQELIKKLLRYVFQLPHGEAAFMDDERLLQSPPIIQINPFGIALEHKRSSLEPIALYRLGLEIAALHLFPTSSLFQNSRRLAPYANNMDLQKSIIPGITGREWMDLTQLDTIIGALLLLTLQDYGIVTFQNTQSQLQDSVWNSHSKPELQDLILDIEISDHQLTEDALLNYVIDLELYESPENDFSVEHISLDEKDEDIGMEIQHHESQSTFDPSFRSEPSSLLENAMASTPAFEDTLIRVTTPRLNTTPAFQNSPTDPKTILDFSLYESLPTPRVTHSDELQQTSALFKFGEPITRSLSSSLMHSVESETIIEEPISLEIDSLEIIDLMTENPVEMDIDFSSAPEETSRMQDNDFSFKHTNLDAIFDATPPPKIDTAEIEIEDDFSVDPPDSLPVRGKTIPK
jgi:hypothetical protein